MRFGCGRRAIAEVTTAVVAAAAAPTKRADNNAAPRSAKRVKTVDRFNRRRTREKQEVTL